ncbi:MAG: M23 family metallopeptidase [Spirochaetaceae bacterium]|nr:M23 family metallopeptidase [Spirochaetaceae bacterium]
MRYKFIAYLLLIPVSLWADINDNFNRLVISAGQTFTAAMQSIGVPVSESRQIVSATASHFNLNRISPGQVIYYRLSTTAGPAVIAELRIDLGDSEVRYFEDSAAIVTGKEIFVSNYLTRLSAAELYERDRQLYLFIERLFVFNINHSTESFANSQLTILFNRYTDEFGNFIKNGPVNFAAMTIGRTTRQAYRFNNIFYDERGRAITTQLFSNPLATMVITSGFGWRLHPTRRFRDFHAAVDYRAATGTPVMAIAAGTVEQMGYDYWLGNFVVIRHANGWHSLYAHFSAFANRLRVGANIQAGAIVGYAGATGVATGPHLHLELHKGNVPVDPRLFLGGEQAPNLTRSEMSGFNELRRRIDRQVNIRI